MQEACSLGGSCLSTDLQTESLPGIFMFPFTRVNREALTPVTSYLFWHRDDRVIGPLSSDISLLLENLGGPSVTATRGTKTQKAAKILQIN